MTRYGYVWFNISPHTPHTCLTAFQTVYSSWFELVEDMMSSLKHAEVTYKLNQDCTPAAVRDNNGEMIFATYSNNYGSYIVKIVTIFD